MEIDRRAFFATLGGAAAATAMTHEARADALEEYMQQQVEDSVRGQSAAAPGAPAANGAKKFPTAAELDAEIETRPYRRGVGGLFTATRGNVQRLLALSPFVPRLSTTTSCDSAPRIIAGRAPIRL